MKVNPFVFGVLAVAIFLGTIMVAQANGIWSVSGKVDGAGGKVTATGANPDEIKGWMTIGELATAYGFSMDELAEKFNLPPDVDQSKQIKEMESEEFSPGYLKEWLKERAAPPSP
jgi:hypothetical protein